MRHRECAASTGCLNHHDYDNVVVVRVRVVVAPDGRRLTGAGAAASHGRVARELRDGLRLLRRVDGRQDQAEAADVRRLLQRGLELVGDAQERSRPGHAGRLARRDHRLDVRVGHGGVLHLEPDEVVVQADLEVELNVELLDRVTEDLLAVQQLLLAGVVEGVLRGRVVEVVGLSPRAAPVRVRRRRRGDDGAGHGRRRSRRVRGHVPGDGGDAAAHRRCGSAGGVRRVAAQGRRKGSAASSARATQRQCGLRWS